MDSNPVDMHFGHNSSCCTIGLVELLRKVGTDTYKDHYAVVDRSHSHNNKALDPGSGSTFGLACIAVHID